MARKGVAASGKYRLGPGEMIPAGKACRAWQEQFLAAVMRESDDVGAELAACARPYLRTIPDWTPEFDEERFRDLTSPAVLEWARKFDLNEDWILEVAHFTLIV